MNAKYTACLLASVLVLAEPPGPIGGQNARRAHQPELYQGLTYRSVGPSRGGRVTAVAGIPSRPATFYMGATGGGVWKTTDYGANWVNVSDGYFATGSIGSIAVAATNPDLVYVGTGSDGIRSNVITGRGVYKSTDAGKTWTFIGLREVGQIGAVIIHPDNPDVVFAAALGNPFRPGAARGVYRTKDGGATWEQVLFVSDSTGAVDLEFAPDDPNEIYASMWRAERKPWTIISGAREGGVYKSEDGGDTWNRLTDGLPNDLRGKSDLAVSPSDPDRVYALIEAPEPEDGLYRSDDRGHSWRQVSSYNPILNRPFYYTNVDADPTNADIVFVNNEGFYKSVDGGESWDRLRTPHGDNHDMWINPNDPDVFVQSNDGGANVTVDGGRTWSTQHNQPTAELYQVDIDDQFPYYLYAGQQDNSTIAVPSLPPYSHPGGATGYWRAIGGCETGPAVPKPGDPDIVYANCKGRFGRYSKSTGQEKQYYVGMANIYGHNPKDLEYRFQRVSPIEVSPHDPSVVYHGSQFLHRTTDEGITWETISPDLTRFDPATQVAPGTPITRDITGEEYYSTLYAIEESPLERDVIYVGANDGPVHVTRDGGAQWREITPPGLEPGGRVQTIDVSPHRPGKAYVAIYRYLLGDYRPYIYRTGDYGLTWKLLTTGENGIPADSPTRVVREDPNREGLLYAGTEFGMYISFDDGASWQPFQLNLPVTPITDVKVHQRDLVLSTMGRGFWIIHDITPLHQINDEVAASQVHLFQPRDAYRMRYSAGGGFRGSSPADPQYPPPGAAIDYYLAETPSRELTLEILDAQGDLVRIFTSSAQGERDVEPARPSMREFSMERVGAPALDTSPGMHRFIWDLEYPGPWSENTERSGRGGPLVVPGEYLVRLSVGNDRIATRRLNVLMDPRVAADGVTIAQLKDQLALSLEVRDALSRARMAAADLEEARRAMADGNSIKRQLEEIKAQLVTATTYRYPTPMLIDQLSYLYSNLNQADQEPGNDAYVRFDALQTSLSGYIDDLERLLRANVSDAGR